MKNVDMKLKGSMLTITIDLTKNYGLSASKKSMIIATTEGNQKVEGMEGVRIGINCYKKQGPEAWNESPRS